ncbi:MAG: hypothetical protein EDX89_07560 [Acidobacteria bacterium]|nr:MAG: hypothetical protein EDX89_07560 [Acidobacteriota bacterium]
MTGPERAARAAGLLLLLSAAAYYLVFVRAMSTTSLWTDELTSVQEFSSKGPLAVVTDYHDPNNHVFFNLLNSLLPGRASVAPLRARILSFLSVAGLLVLPYAFFAGRGRPLLGGLLGWVLVVDHDLLDLFLQARGYGLAAFLALSLSTAVLRFVDEDDPRGLPWIVVTAVLGTWTLPTFGFFAAPLLLLLLAVARRRAVFLASAAVAAGVFLAYLPVLPQLLEQGRVYGARWGRAYASAGAVLETLRTYLLRPRALFGEAAAFAALSGIAVFPWFLSDEERRRSRGSLLLVASSLAFFVACLGLQTPIVRATSFVVVPLAVGTSLVAAVLLDRPRLERRARAAGIAGAILLAAGGFFQAWRFSFVPLERWKDVGELVAETFPDEAQYHVTYVPELLRGYVRPGFRNQWEMDDVAFREGRLVVLDTVVVDGRPRIQTSRLAASSVELRLPQRRAGFMSVCFTPPSRSGVEGVASNGRPLPVAPLGDRDFATGASAAGATTTVALEAGRRYRSLVLVRSDGPGAREVECSIRTSGGAAPEPCGTVRRSGRFTLVHLRDRPVTTVTLTTGQEGEASLVEVWAYTVP